MKKKNSFLLLIGVIIIISFSSCDKVVEPVKIVAPELIGRVKEVKYFDASSSDYVAKSLFFYNDDGTLQYYISDYGDSGTQIDSGFFEYDLEKRVIYNSVYHRKIYSEDHSYFGYKYTYSGSDTRATTVQKFASWSDLDERVEFRYTDFGKTVRVLVDNGQGFNEANYTDYIYEESNLVKKIIEEEGFISREYVYKYDANPNPFEGMMYNMELGLKMPETLPGQGGSPNNSTSWGTVSEPNLFVSTYEFDGDFLVKSVLDQSPRGLMTIEYVYE